MTILCEFGGSVAVTDDNSATVNASIEIIDDDPFVIALDVDDRAAVAYAQRFQRVGAQVSVNGAIVPDRELGKELTITESTDSYGDQLSVRLVGAKYSPFARDLIRSLCNVTVRMKIGAPGKEFDGQVFDGYNVKAEYDLHPPSALLTCLDASALYVTRLAKDYALPANSNRTRLSITLELLAIGGIPIKFIDLGGDGGRVNKPVAPGEQPIVDFLRDFLGILGVSVWFEDGRFVARQFDPGAQPVMEINAGNLVLPATLGLQDTLSPNVTGVVSVAFTSRDASGVRLGEETRVTTVGPYAPMSATGPSTTQVQTISDVITRTSYLGSLDVRTEEETFGWYAVLAAGSKIQPIVDPPGYEIVPTSETVYVYPDGSTRADAREKFRRIGRRVATKDVNADLYVIRTREERYFFHFLRQALFLVIDGEDVLQTVTSIPINDEGQGVLGGREVMGLIDPPNHMEGGLPASSLYLRPDALTETEYTLNADGAIAEEVKTERFYDIGNPKRRANGAWGYGVDQTTYSSLPAETHPESGDDWGGLRITTTRYRAIDEDHYEAVVTVKQGLAPATATTSQLTGSLPRAERAEPDTSSQEIRSVTEDRQRIALARQAIERTEHNEFIETSEEAEFYSRFLAMKASAITLNCELAIETLAHKGRAVLVNLPGSSIDGLKFYLQSVTRNAATYRESISAEYYAPELM